MRAFNAALLLLCTTAAWGQNRPATPELPAAPASQIAAAQPDMPKPSWIDTSPTADYVPLTSRQKFDIFLKRTYSPRTFAGAAFDAGISQASSGHEEYGQGMEGYGKRFGASMADGETGVFFGSFLLPTLFHEDPRYFRRPDLPVARRALYASSRVLLTRTDHGGTSLNVGYLGGSMIGSALANTYYPFHERGLANTLQRFASGMTSDAGLNLLTEFWPDIRRKLFGTRVGQRLEHSKIGQTVEREVERTQR